MATCENCSTSFTPDPNASEVTSTRILCTKCAAERRAEKQRRAAAGAAAGKPAMGASPARASAPPVPVAKRAAAAGAAAAPAARPAAPRAAEPAASTQTTTSRPAARSARPVPEPEATRPSKKNTARAPSDVRREAELIKRQQDKWIVYGWVVCGVLLLIAGVVVVFVLAKKNAQREEIEARARVVAEFLQTAKKFDVNNEAQAQEAVATIEREKEKWFDETTAGEIGGILAKARSNLDRLREVRELQDRLTTAQTTAANAASETAANLAKLRRNMEDLESKSDMVGPEFKARVTELRTNLDRAYINKLHADAKAVTGREALTAYTKAEEETIKLFDLAFKRKNEEQRAFFEQHLKDIILESDALVAAVFTPEVIEKTAWTDLLSDAMKPQWQNDGLKGWRIEGGKLQAVGSEAGSTKDGLMAVPAAGGWRDFQLEMTFVPKGSLDLRFRLGRRVDFTVPGFTLSTQSAESGFKAGQPHMALITMLGSKLTVRFEGGEIPEYSEDLTWTKSRKGAFGVLLVAGSEVDFTKLRLRELR